MIKVDPRHLTQVYNFTARVQIETNNSPNKKTSLILKAC